MDRLQATRTRGVHVQASTLLGQGRVLAHEAALDERRASSTAGAIGRRWGAHICNELRRNRFSTQREEERRNVLPACSPVSRSPSPRTLPTRGMMRPLSPGDQRDASTSPEKETGALGVTEARRGRGMEERMPPRSDLTLQGKKDPSAVRSSTPPTSTTTEEQHRESRTTCSPDFYPRQTSAASTWRRVDRSPPR